MRIVWRRLLRAGGFWANLLVVALLGAGGSGIVSAQVNVTASAGTSAGSYTTLKAAFDAINAGTHQGTIGVAIAADTNETATASLVASGTGSANYTSVQIAPLSGTRTIGGTIAGPLIELNGADNVTIDGQNSGGRALLLRNADTGASASTVLLSNDASNNLLNRISIAGSTTGLTSGVVAWQAGLTTGNDNNTLSNCTVLPAGTNLPVNAIYSIGSTSVVHSGNTINNCDIQDFFSATLPSAGILITSGNSDWTLSNNRLFQTGTRTYTTANTHQAISVQSGGNHTVSGNRVGFAATGSTGIYTMAGNVATRFIALHMSVDASPPSSVQGNVVSAINLSTTSGATTANGALTGINLIAGAILVGTVTPNVIGSISGGEAIVLTTGTTGGLLNGMHLASGTYTVQNNTIAGLTAIGSNTTVGASVAGITLSGNVSNSVISANTIGNSVASSLRAGTGSTTTNSLATGINLATTTAQGSLTVTNNTIQNLTALGTGATSAVRGFMTSASQAGTVQIDVSRNTVSNLQTNSTSSSLSNGQPAAVGISVSLGASPLISENVISNIARTNTGAVSGWSAGISFGNATDIRVLRNRIFGITHASTLNSATAPGIAAGIVIRSGINSVTVANNMIALGAGDTNNTPYIGIQANHGSTPDPTDRIYFNTVHISGTEVAGNNPSFGFLRGDLSATVRNQTIDFRNNLISVTRTGGSGAHYAIANNFGTTASAIGWVAGASDFNVLNALAATVGYWNGNQTLATWRAASNSDQSSQTGVAVTFANPANDLHVNMGTALTFLESNGVTIAGLAEDFDQQVRPGPAGSVNGGGFAPDIGADEFDGVHLDLVPPAIQYTRLITTTQTTDRVLSVTTTDFAGVPTTGGLVPRIYYRRSAIPYVSQPCVLISGTSTSGQWNCPITYAAFGGAAVGDSVEYFVVAQDMNGNVGANPNNGFAASSVNNVTSPPTNPSQYFIGASLSGDYRVGITETITSLTNPNGVFDFINRNVLVGNVRFLITSELTSEFGTVALNPWVEEGVGNYTLTLVPSSTPRLISGNVAGPLIRLNGTDRVRIDGSTTQATSAEVVGGDAALRDMRIQNVNTGSSASVIHLASAGSGAQNNVLRNLILAGGGATTSVAVVSIGGATPLSAGADNNNNQVENCELQAATFGVISIGSVTGNPDTGTVLSKNSLVQTGVDRIRRSGFVITGTDGANVRLNRISIPSIDEGLDGFAIALGAELAGINLGNAGSARNALVTRNEILSVTSNSTFSAIGILISGAAGSTNTVSNNMISGVLSNATNPDLGAGILSANFGGAATRILGNSVVMTGDRGVGAQLPSFAVAVLGNDPSIELKNNTLMNSQVAGSIDAGSYAIGLGSSAFTNLDANFNNYFTSGANSRHFRTGALGIAVGSDHADLAAWQAAIADDANSREQDALHVSATDLHLQTTSPLLGAGTSVVGLSSDFDGQTRDSVTPCIGADELIDVDLQVSKTDDLDFVLNGQSTVYAITVSNAGPVVARNATLLDNLPATLIDGSWMCVQALSTATCPVPSTGVGNLNSTVTVPAGTSLRFDLMATANGSVGGFINNTATVSAASTQNDTVSGNNSATDQDAIVGIGLFANGFEN